MYTANATSSKGLDESEEHIIPRSGGIEYEKKYTVEEEYITA